MSDKQAVADFVQRYAGNCELFVREVFGFPGEREIAEGKEIYAWQSEAMATYDRRERRISIRSGHGVGKTTLLVWITWHHLLFRFPQKTAVTAPTEKQLFNAFWAEFKAWHGRLPPILQELVEIKSDRAELKRAPAESFVSIATARPEQPEALQGIHSDFVLLIADEASGVAEKVFEAAVGSMSGHNAVTLLTGNPVRGSGFFYDTHTRLADQWFTRGVSCFDVPAGVSEDFAKQVADTYGIDSNAYRVRVLGEFPTRDDDTIIPFELVEASMNRDVVIPKAAPIVWGVDCARFGDDRSALAKRQTRKLLEPIKWWAKRDTMVVAGHIKHEWDVTPLHERPAEINVDVIGIGGGVVDRLRELNLPVRGINVQESPAAVNSEKYPDLRTELWFKMRDWFAARDCRLPDYYSRPRREDNLVGELTSVKYEMRGSSGKVAVESKDHMKKRGMRSPDLADAFMMTFASDAVLLQHGFAASSNWRRKISRPLKGIV